MKKSIVIDFFIANLSMFFVIPSSNRGGSPTKLNITLTNTTTNVITSVTQSRLLLSLFIISNTPSQKLAKLT
ncbi:hypothetical protein BUY63_12080 [Staphylococcus epidermidis]|nr:hypothetical protein BUY63_12080 [Staphylococcus epidermidis]